MARQSLAGLIISVCGTSWAGRPLMPGVMAQPKLDLTRANAEIRLLFWSELVTAHYLEFRWVPSHCSLQESECWQEILPWIQAVGHCAGLDLLRVKQCRCSKLAIALNASLLAIGVFSISVTLSLTRDLFLAHSPLQCYLLRGWLINVSYDILITFNFGQCDLPRNWHL